MVFNMTNLLTHHIFMIKILTFILTMDEYII